MALGQSYDDLKQVHREGVQSQKELEFEVHKACQAFPTPHHPHGHHLRPIENGVHIVYVMDALHQEMLDLRAKVKVESSQEELELARKREEFGHTLH